MKMDEYPIAILVFWIWLRPCIQNMKRRIPSSIGSHMSNKSKMSRKVKQGCRPAPTLFNLRINNAVENLSGLTYLPPSLQQESIQYLPFYMQETGPFYVWSRTGCLRYSRQGNVIFADKLVRNYNNTTLWGKLIPTTSSRAKQYRWGSIIIWFCKGIGVHHLGGSS